MKCRRWGVLILGALVCLAMCTAVSGATNLALSATATGEVVPNASYPPSNANDGDFATLYWQGSQSFTANTLWFQLTWDSQQTFSTVVAYFLSHDWGHGRTITLQQEVSPDVWQDIATTVVVTQGTPEFDVATFVLPAKVSLDKIRIVNLIDLFEVEVYDRAEVTVSGYIFATDAPYSVGNATIKAGTASATSACPDGSYQIEVVPGEVLFEVSAPGYAKLEETVVVPESGLAKDFTLSRDTTSLVAGATVTASSFVDDLYESYPPGYATDFDPCTYWEAAGYSDDMGTFYQNEWLQLEWPSAVTVDTVSIVAGSAIDPVSVEVWKDDAWLLMTMDEAPAFPLTIQFSPVETTKLRVKRLWRAYEIEAYNNLGSVQTPNVTGTVTNSLTGQPVVQARVAVGDKVCYTSAAGTFALALPEGPATIAVSKMTYDDASAEIVVPATGTIDRGIVLTTKNIAPSASSVSATVEKPDFPASMCADDRSDTLWMATKLIWGAYVELDWAQPINTNEIKVYGGSGLGQSNYLQVDYWNGSEWRYAANRAVTSAQWNDTVDLQFYPITTTKIRVSGTFAITELEVDQCDPPNPVVQPINALKSLPDGTQVRVTGSVTAGFDDSDSAYVESLDRASAIKCKPWSGFPSASGPNLAPSATATASIVPMEQYGPANAIDGDTATEYYPGSTAVFTNPNAEWLQLTWSEPQTFNRVVAYLPQHAVSRGSVCTLQSYNSETGTWEDFATTTGSADTATPFVYAVFDLAAPVTLDKVRFTNPVDLFELQVFLKGDSALDHEVTVDGTLATDPSGQRYISVGPIVMGGLNPVGPLGMTGKALNGVPGGINTSSLLARVSGTVTATIGDSVTQYVYVDDGSGVQPSALAPGGIKVGPISRTLTKEGDYISVTGIVDYAAAPSSIRPRSDDDVTVYYVGPAQANIALSAAATGAEVPNPDYPPSNANDGNLATEYWAGYSVYSPNSLWLQYTWPSSQTIKRVVAYYMSHDYMHGRTVTLQCETAPDVWGNVASTTVVTVGSYDIALFALPLPLTTDKIRVVNMFDLWEVEVY